MDQNETPNRDMSRGMSDPVKAALIGAVATLLVALISGLVARNNQRATPAPVVNQPVVLIATATNALPTIAPPTDTPQPANTLVVTQPLANTGFAFASQITPDGVAIDPGLAFSADVKQIYAVFQVGRTPPGLHVKHDNPTNTDYYAYLAPSGEEAPASVGWRWLQGGALVNEYETATDGGYFWLSVYNQDGEGLFEGGLGAPGVYDIFITLADNPIMNAQLIAR